jgi:oligoribonuclease (3'-5' exoribonuclease)
MKIVPMDAETTGLDPENDQVLELAVIIEDTEAPELPPVVDLPSWVGRVAYERVTGHPAALKMNAEIIAAMPEVLGYDLPAYDEKYSSKKFPEGWYEKTGNLCYEAIEFIRRHIDAQKFTFAGKNVAGFDMRFMSPYFQSRAHHRVIDVGSVALGGENQWWREDVPPGLGDLTGEAVAHTAIEDARDVVRILRRVTGNYGRGELD